MPLWLAEVGATTFLTGGVLALSYHRTGSLYPGMLGHALFNLPATMGLTLPHDVMLQAMSLLLPAGVLALAVLLTDRRPGGTPLHGAGILRRLNPRVDLGRVEVRPATHLVALAVLGLLATRGLNAPAFALGVYGLTQGAAIASRGPRAVAAVRCGRRIQSARLAPLLVVRLSEDDPWWARRWTAAAGTAGLAVYGLGLLAAQAWLGAGWAPEVQELVVQVGWLCTLASLAEALPVQLPDGHTEDVLWAHPWQPRPRWLAFMPMLLAVSIAAGLVMTQFPVGYTRQTLEPVLGQPVSLLGAVLLMLAAPVTAARFAAMRRTAESPG